MSFSIPEDEDPAGPRAILRRLMLTHSELSELADLLDQEVQLGFMFRLGEKLRQGRMILGTCYMPSVSGDLRPLFDQLLEDAFGYYPDFLIILDAEWWAKATEREREILVFHEALHAEWAKDKYGVPRINRLTGGPVLGIRAHDVEEFNAVVGRYGAWSDDLVKFFAAARLAPDNASQRESGNDVF